MQFFWGSRLQQRVPRGPFRSSKDWITARLLLDELDCQSTLANIQDEEDLEDAERTLKIIRKLQRHLGIAFPNAGMLPEPSMLYNDDLSLHNIMTDDEGTLTGILDWECVSAVPLWKACSYPSFLEGRTRNSEPDRNRYKCDESGEPDSLYWAHLMEHELTLLRRYFIDAMRVLQPQWIEVFEASRMQRDFDFAVDNSDSEFLARHINEWIDEIAAGTNQLNSLCDRIHAS